MGVELFYTLTNLICYLKFEHRSLDGQLEALSADPTIDDLQVRRLKKRKLFLKDSITHLEKQLVPDATA